MTVLYLGTAEAELAIIGHPDNAEAALGQSQVTQIYLGKVKHFPGGAPTKPVDQSPDSAARQAFYAKVIGKSETQIKAYWTKMIFSGKANPPQEMGGDQEVKQWVAGHPEALGYIDAKAVDASVKVLLIVP